VDLLRHHFVDVEARRHEHQVRAFPPGSDGRHGGVDAKLPGFVARGGHHASFTRPTHREREAAQAGVIALLHRCVERIHVDVDDSPKSRGLIGRGHAGVDSSTEAAACERNVASVSPVVRGSQSHWFGPCLLAACMNHGGRGGPGARGEDRVSFVASHERPETRSKTY
jgi:hypothetical protein